MLELPSFVLDVFIISSLALDILPIPGFASGIRVNLHIIWTFG